METFQLILTALLCGMVTALWLQMRARDKEALEGRRMIMAAIDKLREDIQAGSLVPVADTDPNPVLRYQDQHQEEDSESLERRAVLPDAALPVADVFADDRTSDPSEHTKVFQKVKPRGGEFAFNSVRDGALIESSYKLLCAESESKGKVATHCEGSDCWQGKEDVGGCLCECSACRQATSCLLRAYRYVSKRFQPV